MAPFFRASDNPIAIACFGFVTFLPLRPDFSFPSFIARISRSTDFEARGLYFRPLAFFEADFFAADFFALDFFAELFFEAELFFTLALFFALLFFALVFLDGIRTFLHSHSEALDFAKVVNRDCF